MKMSCMVCCYRDLYGTGTSVQHIAVHTLIKQIIKLLDRRPNEGREVGPKQWGGIGLPSLSFDRHDSRRRGKLR